MDINNPYTRIIFSCMLCAFILTSKCEALSLIIKQPDRIILTQLVNIDSSNYSNDSIVRFSVCTLIGNYISADTIDLYSEMLDSSKIGEELILRLDSSYLISIEQKDNYCTKYAQIEIRIVPYLQQEINKICFDKQRVQIMITDNPINCNTKMMVV